MTIRNYDKFFYIILIQYLLHKKNHFFFEMNLKSKYEAVVTMAVPTAVALTV